MYAESHFKCFLVIKYGGNSLVINYLGHILQHLVLKLMPYLCANHIDKW